MSKGKYSVRVIRSKCIGAASCVAIAPKTYKMDKQDKAIVLSQIEAGGEDSDEDKLLGAQSCPTQAVIVKDDRGKQIWPLK